MTTHKDLPGGSQAWAGELDALMAEVKALREVVKRLAGNAGLDYSAPQRGVNAGNTPSIKSPVGQKLSSLADVATYNVAEGQVLSWSQQGQKWLPVTLPSVSGTIDISAISYSQLPVGYGTVTDAENYAYTAAGVAEVSGGTYPTVETWSTESSYMGAGNWNVGPVSLIEMYHDGFGRPVIDLQCEDYADGTYTTLQILSYGIRVASDLFKPPTTTTANRPTPAGLGVVGDPGCQSYDLNLHIPIWWNGTQWTNALGTAV
jgi:hypothetical protein